MRLLNQFLRFELSVLFATPEFINAIIKVVRKCFLDEKMFLGGKIINGVALNADKEYIKTDWEGLQVLIFYNGLNRFLLTSEYRSLPEGGFQIFLDNVLGANDNFIVFPTNEDLSSYYALGTLFTTEGVIFQTTEGQDFTTTQ